MKIRFLIQVPGNDFNYKFTYLKDNTPGARRKYIRVEQGDAHCGTYNTFQGVIDNFEDYECKIKFKMEFKYNE